MLIGLSVIFLLISLLLFTGKGSWLIAGYNTASKKEKYDQQKLCNVMGIMCAIIAAMTGILAWLNDETYAIIYGIILFIVVTTTLFYVNTKCKKY